MANLSVRKLDDKTYERLRIRAAQHGVSMEEEARQILKRSTAAPEKMGNLFLKYFGPANGVALELPPREPHQPLDLSQ